MFFDALRPALRIEFDPVVPFLHGSAGNEMAVVAFEINHRKPLRNTTQLFGTLCPAITKHHSNTSTPARLSTALSIMPHAELKTKSPNGIIPPREIVPCQKYAPNGPSVIRRAA